MFAHVLAAQEVTVQGRVTYQTDRSALPGVTIMVVGTNVGTLSDANGAFTIPAKIGATLKFTFIGMTPVEVPVTSATVNVEMADAPTDLDGGANFTYYASSSGAPVTGSSWAFNADFTKLTIKGNSNILGSMDCGANGKVFEIKEFTADKLTLFVSNGGCSTGWVWEFVPVV